MDKPHDEHALSQQEAGELSDEDLEQAAGGTGGDDDIIIIEETGGTGPYDPGNPLEGGEC